MDWHKLREEYGEDKRDHFKDMNEYLDYLTRTRQYKEVWRIERMMREKGEGEQNGT